MSVCVVCGRKKTGKLFCHYHEKAFENLEKKYEIWKSRYGTLSWKEYLEKQISLDQNGTWVKEVIRHLLKFS